MVLLFATLGRAGDIALCYTQGHILHRHTAVELSCMGVSTLPGHAICAAHISTTQQGARARAQGGRALGPPLQTDKVYYL